MDLRKGEKSLKVFQILKRIQHTAALAPGTHLSQKPRDHLHLHAETVPFVLDHDNDLEFRWAFHPEGRVAPAEAGPASSSLQHQGSVSSKVKGEQLH